MDEKIYFSTTSTGVVYPYLYISTNSAGGENENSDPLNAPTSANSLNGIQLSGTLNIVDENSKGFFYVDPGSNPVTAQYEDCDFAQPIFGFRMEE